MPKAQTQTRMFYDASRRLSDRDQAVLELLYGPNPLSDDELRNLIAKRPERYSRYEGFLGKRGGG